MKELNKCFIVFNRQRYPDGREDGFIEFRVVSAAEGITAEMVRDYFSKQYSNFEFFVGDSMRGIEFSSAEELHDILLDLDITKLESELRKVTHETNVLTEKRAELEKQIAELEKKKSEKS